MDNRFFSELQTLVSKYAKADASAPNLAQYNNEAPIQQGSIQNPYQEFTFTIPAGSQVEQRTVFNYFRILTYTGTAGDLRVRFGGSGYESVFSGAGIGYNLGLPVDRVFFRNNGASPITLTIATAVGTISDDRLNVSGTITVAGAVTVTSGNVNSTPVTNQNNPTAAAVSVTTTPTLLLAQSSTRQSFIIVNNDPAATLYIGDSAVTTSSGIPLAPGQSYGDNNNGGALYGRAGSGTIDTRVMSN